MAKKIDRNAVTPRTLASRAVGQYYRAGWTGVLEFDPGRKSPPPGERTGYTGQDLDVAQVRSLVCQQGLTNLGLRLPRTVVAIDVDVYDKAKGTKAGDKTLATLEKRLGKLPATWSSTARGQDSPSRQYLFRVPEGTHLRKGNKLTEEWPGIDLIQWFHRYTICWPSTNDEAGGAQYRWYRSDGTDSEGQVPRVEELPELPEEWIEELTDPEGGQPFARPSGSVSEWLAAHDDGHDVPDTGPVRRAFEAAERDMYSGAGRHDVMIRHQTNLVRLVEKGRKGALEALRELQSTFVAAVGADRRPGEAEAEWDRALAGAVGEIVNNPSANADASSWEPKNPDAVLAGTYVRLEPTILERNDGKCLLYSGKTHWIAGEPESGKSWITLIAAAQILCDPKGGRVLFVDYEDDMPEVVGRLLALGVPRPVLAFAADRFRYVQPETAHDASSALAAFATLLTQTWALVILDAVTEALSMEGKSGREENEFADWATRVPKRFAQKTGAAVVCVDHVVKSTEHRGRWAIGSQHKLAVVSGVSYQVEVVEEIAPGQEGSLLVWVAKDRIGSVRRIASNWDKSTKMKLAARVVLDATDENSIQTRVWEPKDEDKTATPGWTGNGNRKIGSEPAMDPEALKKAIEDLIRINGPRTLTEIRPLVAAKNERVAAAVRELLGEGRLAQAKGSRRLQMPAVP